MLRGSRNSVARFIAPRMGPRPGTPDSLPAIGPLPGHANIFIVAGHGHLGLTGAPRTAQRVAALVCAEQADVALAPYAPGWFR